MNIKKTDCSGCMACENVCPAHCIQIRTTTTGNFIRLIDDSHCRHCGRCETVCPTRESGWLTMPRKAYIAWSKKTDKRSSSGGIAASIYRYCLSHHMECVGVKYDEACFPVMLKGKIESRLGTTVKTLGLAAAAGSLMSKNTDRLKTLSDKHLAMFLLMNEWMKIKQAGKHIRDYLAKNGYKSVAVYGLSYVGVHPA